MSQEKLQTMVVQKFWRVIEVYYEIVQVVNCRILNEDQTFIALSQAETLTGT